MRARTTAGASDTPSRPTGRPPRTSTPGNRRGTGGTRPPAATRFRPGISGNYSGRPAGDGLVRKLILEAFKASRADALHAIQVRLKSPKYVQDVLELLARLEGELHRDGAAPAGGVSVIVIRGEGAISPAEFRAGADRRMAIEARASQQQL